MRLDFWGLIRRDQAEPPTLGGGSAPFSDGGSVASDVPQNSFIATPTTTTSTVASPSAPVILFEDTFFSGQDDRIFNAVASTGSEPSVGGSSKTLSWLIEDKSADITDVSWLGRRENDGEFERIVTADNDDDKFDADSPFDSVSLNQASLNLSAIADDKFSIYLNHPMAIRVDWETDFYTGYSQSGVFAIVDPDLSDTKLMELEQYINGLASVTGTQSSGLSKPTASASLGLSAHPSGAHATTTVGPESTQTDGSSDDNNSSDSKSGGGGLSTGAIAGIGVAAGIIFLLALGALLWFLFRRRRQNTLRGYTPQETSNTLMVEKEPHQAAPEDSPRGYSDDGNIAPLPPLNASRHDAQTAYAPYDAAAERDMSPPGTAAGEQGVSRSVAHLVEDGMTADEIRRLEDEERQLDAEIERAGRR